MNFQNGKQINLQTFLRERKERRLKNNMKYFKGWKKPKQKRDYTYLYITIVAVSLAFLYAEKCLKVIN